MDILEQAESLPSAVYEKKKNPKPCSDPRRELLCQGAAALGGKPTIRLWRGMRLHLQCEKSVSCPSEGNLYGGAGMKQTAVELVRLSLNVMLLRRPDCNITVDVNLWCS